MRLLGVDGVSVTFEGLRAIDSLSLSMGEPEFRAIIGPNGADKTTFLDIVTGKTRLARIPAVSSGVRRTATSSA